MTVKIFLALVALHFLGADSVLNGIAIGALLTSTIGALVAAFASGGDIPFSHAFVSLAPAGALMGFFVDVAREQNRAWEVTWRTSE